MRTLILPFLFAATLFSQTPDIQQDLTFTGTGLAPANNRIFVGGTGGVSGMVGWRLTFYVDGTNFTAATVAIQGADAANSAGCQTASYSTITAANADVVESVNPAVSAAKGNVGVKAYFPCIAINVTGVTGSGGTVTTHLSGYKGTFVFPTTTSPSGTQNVNLTQIGSNTVDSNSNGDLGVINSCPGSPVFVNVSGSGNTQIVAASATKKIVVCSLILATGTPEDIKFTEGTGSNCAAGTADASALYKNISALAHDALGLVYTQTAGDALCINQANTQALGITVWSRYQ